MGRRIRGILFDLGDTLLDFGKIDVPKLFKAGAGLAYEYLRQLDQPLPSFGRYHRRQLWAIRWNYFKSRLTGREFNSLDLMARIAGTSGHELTGEQLIELAWRWYQPLGETATVEEGLPEMLAGLREAGLTLGLVSNTFVPAPVLDRHLQRERLLDWLPVRVYSCDVGYRKPLPEIFTEALGRAGLKADETMFVGDSVRADILGANRVGMVSVLKDPADRHADGRCPACHRIQSVLQVRQVLQDYDVGG